MGEMEGIEKKYSEEPIGQRLDPSRNAGTGKSHLRARTWSSKSHSSDANTLRNPLPLFMSNDRTALVTGGNRGIGLAICKGLAERGLNVVLGFRDEVNGEAAARPIREDGGTVRVEQVDVAEPDSIRACYDRLASEAYRSMFSSITRASTRRTTPSTPPSTSSTPTTPRIPPPRQP